MSEGWVYGLVNDSMPGIVKIGKTTRGVDSRCSELFTTGVPEPFKVQFKFFSPDCDWLEREIHARLSECRINPSREFFKIDKKEAYLCALSLLVDQVNDKVGMYLPGFGICPSYLTGFVEKIADISGAHPISEDDVHHALIYSTSNDIIDLLGVCLARAEEIG